MHCHDAYFPNHRWGVANWRAASFIGLYSSICEEKHYCIGLEMLKLSNTMQTIMFCQTKHLATLKMTSNRQVKYLKSRGWGGGARTEDFQ